MRIVIVDDDQIAIDVLKHNLLAIQDLEAFKDLEGISNMQLVATYKNPKTAVENFQSDQPDLVFLDMEMDEMTGLQCAEAMLRHDPFIAIVFATSYSQYALSAFEINAIDYILKPVNIDRLQRTMERFIRRNPQLMALKSTQPNDTQPAEIEVDPPSLRVRSFSSFQLLKDDYYAVHWRTKKVKELMAYLWHNSPRPTHKQVLMEILWPNMRPSKATTHLHTTVYQLRRTLAELGFPDALIHQDDGYSLHLDIPSDYHTLKDIINRQNLTPWQVQQILTLYTGPFLGSDDFLWAELTRQHLENQVARLLSSFAEATLKDSRITGSHCPELMGLVEQALMLLLREDPYNEKAASNLLALYAVTSHWSAHQRFFEDFSNRLERELGVTFDPSVI